jgi:hypothetical protein
MYEKINGKLPNDSASTRKETKIVCSPPPIYLGKEILISG